MSAVNLSENVLVPCPEREFAYRKVRFCLECEHYQGIAHASHNGEPLEGDEADVYQIICGRPITRKLVKISED